MKDSEYSFYHCYKKFCEKKYIERRRMPVFFSLEYSKNECVGIDILSWDVFFKLMALNVFSHLILTNIQSGIIIIYTSQFRKWKIDKLSNLAIISQVITDGGRCWAHSSLFNHSIYTVNI